LKELIDHIPFLDVIILGALVLFIWLGWNQGLPRFAMVVASIYTGFLLSSIYYHLFAVALAKAFNLTASFVADLISFLVLDAVITVLMLALLVSLFGHIEIGGKLAIFDKLGGTLLGMLSGILVVGIVVTMLHVPYEANKQKLNSGNDMPVVKLFNQGYERSALAPLLVKAAPVLVASIKPMLPPAAQEKGTVPLLEGVIAQVP
jgi:uncharacterized membrane protein required for colicin V production